MLPFFTIQQISKIIICQSEVASYLKSVSPQHSGQSDVSRTQMNWPKIFTIIKEWLEIHLLFHPFNSFSVIFMKHSHFTPLMAVGTLSH